MSQDPVRQPVARWASVLNVQLQKIANQFRKIGFALENIANKVKKFKENLKFAIQPLAEIKQAIWKNMGKAFKAIKESAGPLITLFEKLGILELIFRPLGMMLRIIGAAAIKKALPAIQKLFEVLTSDTMINLMNTLGEIIGTVLLTALELLIPILEELAPLLLQLATFFSENEWAIWLLLAALAPLAVALLGVAWAIQNWETIVLTLQRTLETIETWIDNTFIAVWEELSSWLEKAYDWVKLIFNLGIPSGGGGDEGGGNAVENFLEAIGIIESVQSGGNIIKSGLAVVHKKERVLNPMETKLYNAVIDRREAMGAGEIHIHIDLRNAYIDNTGQLARQIAEQVILEIG